MAGAARLLLNEKWRPRRTVQVVLFASEEFGGHSGRDFLEQHVRLAERGRFLSGGVVRLPKQLSKTIDKESIQAGNASQSSNSDFASQAA